MQEIDQVCEFSSMTMLEIYEIPCNTQWYYSPNCNFLKTSNWDNPNFVRFSFQKKSFTHFLCEILTNNFYVNSPIKKFR